MEEKQNNEILIYKHQDKGVEVKLDAASDTVWLRQEQIGQLFARERSVISKHLRNIFQDEELDKNEVCAKFAHTAEDGKTYQVTHYNLDIIISVGYRVKSLEGTRFRQWATSVLRQHLIEGYTLNNQRLEHNARELETALQLVKKAAQSPDLLADAGKGLIEIVTQYAQTFLLLQRYDEGLLSQPPVQEGGKIPTPPEARAGLASLKKELIGRNEATDLFAKERGDAFEALLGNLEQTVFGVPAYPSIESKAAHLLYFVVKNHPFADGNKRSAAFLFLDFLNRNNRLLNQYDQPVVNDIGLAALTLLVAESDPKNKDMMISLIMNMLSEKR